MPVFFLPASSSALATRRYALHIQHQYCVWVSGVKISPFVNNRSSLTERRTSGEEERNLLDWGNKTGRDARANELQLYVYGSGAFLTPVRSFRGVKHTSHPSRPLSSSERWWGWLQLRVAGVGPAKFGEGRLNRISGQSGCDHASQTRSVTGKKAMIKSQVFSLSGRPLRPKA